VIVSTVATMLLVPFSLPPVAHYLARLQIEADLVTLSLRLATFIFLAFCIAAVIKRVMGRDRIIKSAREIDGISVLCIGIFIVAIMHGVTDTAMEQPWFVFQVFTASSLLVFGLYVVSTAIFWRLGARSAMAVGLVCGNCNMGLMYLVLAGQASLDVLIFFAIGQVPMYFLPALLSPLVDRVLHKRC
jgi:BASS family bile acid:Na+ symporter